VGEPDSIEEARKYLGRFGLSGDLALRPIRTLRCPCTRRGCRPPGPASRVNKARLFAWKSGLTSAAVISSGLTSQAEAPCSFTTSPRTKRFTRVLTKRLTRVLTKRLTRVLTKRLTRVLTKRLTRVLTKRLTQVLTKRLTRVLTKRFTRVLKLLTRLSAGVHGEQRGAEVAAGVCGAGVAAAAHPAARRAHKPLYSPSPPLLTHKKPSCCCSTSPPTTAPPLPHPPMPDPPLKLAKRCKRT
jgi:hypothetical protein